MQTIKCVLIWCIKAGTNQANFKKQQQQKQMVLSPRNNHTWINMNSTCFTLQEWVL